MGDWLMSLAEPIYGIVDLFLDQPIAAIVTTSAFGLLIAAALSLR